MIHIFSLMITLLSNTGDNNKLQTDFISDVIFAKPYKFQSTLQHGKHLCEQCSTLCEQYVNISVNAKKHFTSINVCANKYIMCINTTYLYKRKEIVS